MMTKARIEVIQTLRKAAHRLEHSNQYQWGHMGLCNCGFLAQVVTGQTSAEIHACAMRGYGDWTEQLNDYCSTTGMPMDSLIDQLMETGFDREELAQLERLSNPEILRRLPAFGTYLQYNRKEDVALYIRAWASMLEETWLLEQKGIDLGDLTAPREAEKKYSLSPGSPG